MSLINEFLTLVITMYAGYLLTQTDHIYMQSMFACSKTIGLCVDIIIRGQILINNGIFLYMQT